jgi:hypothetical protein
MELRRKPFIKYACEGIRRINTCDLFVKTHKILTD